MAQWRRKNGSDTWHWCRNCNNDPKSDYDSRSDKPTTGDLCNECKSKEREGKCSST